MSTQKGITLMSLILYIVAIVIVIGVLSIVTTTFYNNIRNFDSQSKFEAEYNKVKLFLLEDTKERKMKITQVVENRKGIVLVNDSNDSIKYSSTSTGFYRENVLVSDKLNITFSIEGKILKAFVEYIENNEVLYTKTLQINTNN